MRVLRFPRRSGPSMGRPRSGKFKVLPLLLFAGFFAFYMLSNQETVPLTGRTQIVDISRVQEASLGLQSYRQILKESQVVSSGRDVERVNAIGAKLAKVIEADGFEWEFNLIKSDQMNAFCLPGGKVAIYTGILPIAANDDGLAVIMGHEIAHAVARHGAERMAQQRLKQFGQIALGASVSEMSPQAQQMVMGAFGLGTQFGVMLPYSRKHESEADYMGLMYLARSCFNPEEAPKVWQRMLAAQSSRPLEFLSTHPDPRTRITQFYQWMPEAKREWSKHCSAS